MEIDDWCCPILIVGQKAGNDVYAEDKWSLVRIAVLDSLQLKIGANQFLKSSSNWVLDLSRVV